MLDVDLKLKAVRDAVDALDVALHPVSTPAVRVVKAGEDLQVALALGVPLELEAATWEGTYTLSSRATLTGRVGAKIHGLTGPALVIPPGMKGVTVSNLELTSDSNEVVSVGENSVYQTTASQAPTDILFAGVKIPKHRGKRAFAIHGSVTLLNCEVLDCWDPAGQDSQAIYIGNTPGPIQITGGRYSAGSEVFLCGGDATKIPHVVPTGITVDGVEFFRPLSWQTDGVKRKVKNLFELKNGRSVRVVNCKFSGCWVDGQQGECFVLTPALDGAITTPPLQSGEVLDVLIQDCTIADVSSGFNIQGRAYSAVTPNALTNLVVRRVSLVASKAKYGGRGQLALISGEPGTIVFENVTAITDGTSLIYYSPGNVLDPVTTLPRPAGKIGSLSLTNSKGNLGAYGIMTGGNANARLWQEQIGVLTVTDNQFGGNTAMAVALPGNTYQSQVFTS